VPQLFGYQLYQIGLPTRGAIKIILFLWATPDASSPYQNVDSIKMVQTLLARILLPYPADDVFVEIIFNSSVLRLNLSFLYSLPLQVVSSTTGLGIIREK
jgi:hypothetical protein